jgi:hypothetical protein
MMVRRTTFRSAAIAGCLMLAVQLAPGRAEEPGPIMLVTAEEAALPNLTPVKAAVDQSEGPEIRVESPENDGVYGVGEGFPVEVLFQEGPSGEAVNPDSLRVVYKKAWGIDITSRIREYIQPDSIRVPNADFPPGKHTVKIYIEDVEKNPSSRHLTVTVQK